MKRTLFLRKLKVVLLLVFFTSLYAQVAVNEVMSSNISTLADEDGDYNDWIEIYNYGTTPVDLTGYGLSDAAATPFKWLFPAVTIAPNQYILIWASDKNRAVPGQPLHANFKISAGGEPISLTAPGGTPSDIAPAVALNNDVSYGRQPDGTGAWLYFYTPTPGTANTGTGLSELLTPPAFSHASGLYNQQFTLSLTHPNPNAVIVYTLDGSEPLLNNLGGTAFNYKNAYKLQPTDAVGPLLTETYSSYTYTAPLAISDRSSQPNKITNKNTRQDPLYTPPNPVKKATVVRARAYVNGVPSEIISKTYFVWNGGNPYQLPVLSLQIQEDKLFDYHNGVYTAGKDFDDWRAANPDSNQWYRPDWCNYWRSGALWEYPAHVEYFSANSLNSVMNINGGFRIHGNNSRANAIKNLRLYAKSDYDDVDVFEHQFFNEKIPGAVNPDNKFYKRLMIRGEGAGGPAAYDVVFNRAMQPFFNGISRIQPIVHFINGEYWGITALRDRIDKYHYEYNFDLDADDMVIIDCTGSNCELDEGTNADYQAFISFRDFIIMNDMANPVFYSQVASQMDIDSFIDHMLIEIYAANDSYERAFWKVRTPGTQPYAEGKWRLTVKDFEASLKSNINWLSHWISTTATNESMLHHLIANNEFKNKFINRFADLMNSAFTTTRFHSIVNTTFNEVAPYLAEDANRFPRTNFYTNSNKQNLLNWGTSRPDIQREQIRNQFGISGNLNISLNISNMDAGTIKMNTIKIDPTTPGIPQNPYPWTGVYFNNIPVTLEATAKDGFVFSHWSGDASGTNPSITITPTGNISVTAHFSPITSTVDQVVYFWMMTSAIPNDTPLTSLSATYSKNSLNAEINYISCLTGYPFTSTDPNWRKASMERKNVPTPLNYHPEANNNAPYASGSMRGIQIRQPFRSGTQENIMEFILPTTNLTNVKFSLAAKSDGGAEVLLIEYWNGTQWTNAGLPASQAAIGVDFAIILFDFSAITVANNNPTFKIRLRFDGADMISDTGKAVHINNIALEGQVASLATGETPKKNNLKIFPNPASHQAHIISEEIIEQLIVYSVSGKMVHQNKPQRTEAIINLENLETGIYFVKVKTKSGEKTLKLLKK